MKFVKYNFFKNSSYAVTGLIEILKNETSFRVEVICAVICSIFLWVIDIPLEQKVILQSVTMFVLIVEAINSAIERCVDLVTQDYHELAKNAKDAGSTAVLLTILVTLFVWLYILGSYWLKLF